MAVSSTAGLVFTVRRKTPELVAPARSTPHEYKPLSDIDDQEGLRFQIPVIQFYRKDGAMEGRDPVKVIREAVAKTLVWYYPFAGRLRELGAGRKLMVHCTGEGVLFIEADADVTRLGCGGFIVALRLNHTMSDAPGLVQFMEAVGEVARGADSISVQPVWQRELLSARNPQHVTCTHHEYAEVPDTKGTIIPLDDMAHRSFFFGHKEVSALRKFVPPHLQDKCSTFEAKADVTEEYMRSLADLMVIRGRPHFTVVRGYLVSDVTRAGFRDVDFGWGKAAYGGPAKGGVGAIPGVASFYIPFTNKNGETGIVVPFCLPGPAMDRFMIQLDSMLNSEKPTKNGKTSTFIASAM
ncbi:hypothetical protein C3L33_16278, partial [Rhododendron williamsianum]